MITSLALSTLTTEVWHAFLLFGVLEGELYTDTTINVAILFLLLLSGTFLVRVLSFSLLSNIFRLYITV